MGIIPVFVLPGLCERREVQTLRVFTRMTHSHHLLLPERDRFIVDKLRDNKQYRVAYARNARFQNSFLVYPEITNSNNNMGLVSGLTPSKTIAIPAVHQRDHCDIVAHHVRVRRTIHTLRQVLTSSSSPGAVCMRRRSEGVTLVRD